MVISPVIMFKAYLPSFVGSEITVQVGGHPHGSLTFFVPPPRGDIASFSPIFYTIRKHSTIMLVCCSIGSNAFCVQCASLGAAAQEPFR
jgi:hypothetical protein